MGAAEELLKLANALELKAMKEELQTKVATSQKNNNNDAPITLKRAMQIVDDLITSGVITEGKREKILKKLASAKESDIEALYRLLDIGLLPETKSASLYDTTNDPTLIEDEWTEFFEKHGYPNRHT